MRIKQILLFSLWTASSACANAAPDEVNLGKTQGYPVGTAENWFFDEQVRVGSFSAQAEIPGIFGGKANVLAPSGTPMPLARVDHEPLIRWTFDQRNNLTVDDYLARQRIMGLMIIKDGVIQVERYQYDRHRAAAVSVEFDGKVDRLAGCRHRAA